MRRWIWFGAIAAAVATGLWWLSRDQAPSPTPLTGFTAPFVFGQFSVPPDNPLTEEAVELGRRLFHDPRLSGTNTIACATCHEQHRAFTDGRPTAIGASGVPLAFNSMSLANLLWGPQRYFWDGRADSLEAQALVPIQHADEMAQDLTELERELESDADYVAQFRVAYGEVSADNVAKALASFVRTLVSANSKYDRYLRGEVRLTAQEELGRKLFMAHPDVKVSLRGGNCIDCHSQFLTAGFKTRFDGFANNGLDSEADLPPGLAAVTADESQRGLFKVPTLRNIGLTAPYMHDGRFATLEAVLDHYNEGIVPSSTLSPLIAEASNIENDAPEKISLHLTDEEKAAIIAFLHTLTDEAFVVDPRFSNPFGEDSSHG